MTHLIGALAGWRRTHQEHGIVLSLQLAATIADAQTKRTDRIDLALNERQLRSFARDLVRAAEEQNIQLFAAKPWWRGWLSRPGRPIA